MLPSSVQCGGLQRLLLDVVLWFSSGGTLSVLHYDEMDNLNCVLDGHKQLFLVDVVSGRSETPGTTSTVCSTGTSSSSWSMW